MSIPKVLFISPQNKRFVVNYENVEEFCKKICLNDINKIQFNLYKDKYTYFTPYFDFVMFELNYIFINPVFSGNYGLFHFDGALYLIPVNSFNYNCCCSLAEKIVKNQSQVPFMTKVSDNELDITKSNPVNTFDVIIDPNLYGMMSKTGTVDGSHGVTANSVLNQLLIKSRHIVNDFYKFIMENHIDITLDPINYVTNNLGFLRATSNEALALLIGNTSILNEELKRFVIECQNNGYTYFDIDNTNAISYISEYKRILKK